MIYTDDDLIPLSYISQYDYCKRRAGLIMLEQQWEDNIHTAEGNIIHERVHSSMNESRSGLILLRSVPLVSYSLGLTGKSDCIEIKKDNNGTYISGLSGKWSIYPVEYKHGVTRNEYEYELQVCAQAMCLEEMIKCNIKYGYIYYEGTHRRMEVEFNDQKRKRVKEIALNLHKMQTEQLIPPAIKSRKCNECSMQNVCLPNKLKNPITYISRIKREVLGE